MEGFVRKAPVALLATMMAGGANADFNLPFFSDYAPVGVSVMDAYAEVRTGPGRGYPVVYTVEQGEEIELLKHRPGWYEIVTASGQQGWTTAREISRTIQATGEPADLPDIGYGDYVNRRWWTGFSGGRFVSGDFDNFDLISLTGGYRFMKWFSAGFEHGRAYGTDSSGRQYGVVASVEPISAWRFSPFISAGVGRLNLENQPRQVSFNAEDADYYHLGVGVSYYLGRRFAAKVEARGYEVDDGTNSETMGSVELGFITFF